MEYRTLGNDLTVSAVGLGCMGMSHAYGAPANKKEMTELLAQAVGMGYTFFDTAEVYGTPDNPHDNEELVGAALKPYRDKIVLTTKFGIHFDMTSTAVNKPLVPDSRPEVIRASVDASLKRLGELPGDYHVCPGHMGLSTLERERKTNYYMQEALQG